MQRIHRRDFLKGAAAGAGVWVTGVQRGFGQEKSPNAKLNIAGIGVGGRGGADLKECAGENIVAICDVDEKRGLGPASKAYPNAKKYTDFRKLFDDQKEFEVAGRERHRVRRIVGDRFGATVTMVDGRVATFDEIPRPACAG